MKTVMCFMSILAAAIGADAASPEERIVVRTYNYAGVPQAQLAGARLEADHIFRRARISIAWIDCRVPGGVDGAACTEPLADRRELMLRLVDRPPAQGERIVALGESLLDREQRGGVLMTVDLLPIRRVVDRTSTSITTLLGRAVAHEIGHLLLGSAEHSRLGLMRAFWSHDELRGAKPAHWGFSNREAARMRQMLRGRPHTAD